MGVECVMVDGQMQLMDPLTHVVRESDVVEVGAVSACEEGDLSSEPSSSEAEWASRGAGQARVVDWLGYDGYTGAGR